eukprot:10968544-Ditylum_brightwellii.AAC.1
MMHSMQKEQEKLWTKGGGTSRSNQNLFWVIGRGPHRGIYTLWEGGVADVMFGPSALKHHGFQTFQEAMIYYRTNKDKKFFWFYEDE